MIMQNEDACLLFAFEFPPADFAAASLLLAGWTRKGGCGFPECITVQLSSCDLFALSFVFIGLPGTDRIFSSLKNCILLVGFTFAYTSFPVSLMNVFQSCKNHKIFLRNGTQIH